MNYLGPFPDEDLFSILSRYHIVNGLSKAATRKSITGSNNGARFTKYDTIKVIDFLSDYYGMKVNKLVRDHTLIPFYSPFIGGAPEEYIDRKLLSDLRIEGRHNRVCYKCLEVDTNKYGVAYFHRTHQLPTVDTCYKHKNVLQRYDYSGSVHEVKYFIPEIKSPTEFDDSDDKVFLTEKERYSFRKLDIKKIISERKEKSKNYSALAKRIMDSGIGTIDADNLNQIYIDRLSSLDLYDEGNGILEDNMYFYLNERIGYDENDFYSGIYHKRHYMVLNHIKELIDRGFKRNKIHNKFDPDMHIMMIKLFFDSLEEWRALVSGHEKGNSVIDYLRCRVPV